MVEIGGKPILWHILSHYARYGFADFIIALGYKGEMIKRWARDLLDLDGDLTVDLKTNGILRSSNAEPKRWRLTLVETGLHTMTGGRLKRLAEHLRDPFMLTYGDGVSNVGLPDLLAYHRSNGTLATITATRPPARFGELAFAESEPHLVRGFSEKPQTSTGWINGGFMVLDPAVLDRIEGDHTQLERDVLEPLAMQGKLGAYRHEGFWQCMDTIRDVKTLEALWESGSPPWLSK